MMTYKTKIALLAPVFVGAAFGFAMPAMAQDGLCGGVGTNGQWIGGTEATSDVSTAAAAMEQMALVLQSNEYVALFTVSAATDVRIEAEGRGTGDPIMDVRDATGNIILSDDDSGGNGAARGEMMLQPGNYCVSMKSYDGAPMTGFVRVGLLTHEALTDGVSDVPIDNGEEYFSGTCDMAAITTRFGDGPIDADLAAGGVSVSVSADQAPFIGFTLSAAASISLTAENLDADPTIAIYDSFGNYIAENDDYDGLNSRIDVSYPLEPGEYCVTLGALTDTTLPINLTLSTYDAAAAMVGMYERGEASPPMDGSYPITALGPLATRLRQDAQISGMTTWYSVDIAEAGVLLIEAVATVDGDPTLVLFDDFGRQVGFNDDNGNSLDSLLTARVTTGTYLVGVKQLDDTTTSLVRILFERYVAAK